MKKQIITAAVLACGLITLTGAAQASSPSTPKPEKIKVRCIVTPAPTQGSDAGGKGDNGKPSLSTSSEAPDGPPKVINNVERKDGKIYINGKEAAEVDDCGDGPYSVFTVADDATMKP